MVDQPKMASVQDLIADLDQAAVAAAKRSLALDDAEARVFVFTCREIIQPARDKFIASVNEAYGDGMSRRPVVAVIGAQALGHAFGAVMQRLDATEQAACRQAFEQSYSLSSLLPRHSP